MATLRRNMVGATGSWPSGVHPPAARPCPAKRGGGCGSWTTNQTRCLFRALLELPLRKSEIMCAT